MLSESILISITNDGTSIYIEMYGLCCFWWNCLYQGALWPPESILNFKVNTAAWGHVVKCSKICYIDFIDIIWEKIPLLYIHNPWYQDHPGSSRMSMFSAATWNINTSYSKCHQNIYWYHQSTLLPSDTMLGIWCVLPALTNLMSRSILPLEWTLLSMVLYVLWNCVHANDTSWQQTTWFISDDCFH